MSLPAEASLAAGPQRRARRVVTTPFLAGVLVSLLAFQFLLGTYLEIFVPIPPGRDLGAIPFEGLVVLVLHIILGIMVVGTSLRMTFVAARARNGRETALSAIAALGMIVAFLGGSSFTLGNPSDVLSFVMAFGSFLGLIGSGVLLASTHAPRRPTEGV